MFWPAGFLMDRFGRKVAAVPSFVVMALGMLLVARATDYQGLLIAASIIGFGNGLGSGTMMTLGADLAPPGAVGEFLGVWRMIGDTGQSAGPLIVGPATEALGAAASAILLSGVGFLAALTLAVLVRETNAARRPAVRRT
jgi:MFS family permease